MVEDQSRGGFDISGLLTKSKDLEDKYRVLKDRTLLIGQNLIDVKENHDKKLLEIKKDLEQLKLKVERLTSFIETLSEEFSNFAKKEDLDILKKQAKMFQPLEFVRKSDLERLKNN